MYHKHESEGGSFINGHLGIASECCKVATLAEKGTRRARIGHECDISFFKFTPRVDHSEQTIPMNALLAKREGIAFSREKATHKLLNLTNRLFVSELPTPLPLPVFKFPPIVEQGHLYMNKVTFIFDIYLFLYFFYF